MMFYLILTILLISPIQATFFPSYAPPCPPIICGDLTNVTSCIVSCCCVWCNSTTPNVNGLCIQSGLACMANTGMIECSQEQHPVTYIIVVLSIIGFLFLLWLIWVAVKMTSNIRLCCNQEYTPMSHV